MNKQKTYTLVSGRSVKLNDEELFDDNFTLLELRKEIERHHAISFAGSEFCTPKELASWISIHAGKLQSLFLVMSSKRSMVDIKEDVFLRQEVEEKITDILALILILSNLAKIGLARPLFHTLEEHRRTMRPGN